MIKKKHGEYTLTRGCTVTLASTVRISAEKNTNKIQSVQKGACALKYMPFCVHRTRIYYTSEIMRASGLKQSRNQVSDPVRNLTRLTSLHPNGQTDFVIA